MKTATIYTEEEFNAKWPNRTFVLGDGQTVTLRRACYCVDLQDGNGYQSIDVGYWQTGSIMVKELASRKLDKLEKTIAVLTEIRDFLKSPESV